MSIGIEVSCPDEVRLDRCFKDSRWREKWRVGEFAANLALFGFVRVGID